jgi:MFS family permease
MTAFDPPSVETLVESLDPPLPAGPPPALSWRRRIVVVLLVAAVGLAFADASVVALALPDLYAEFDTTIVGVSWVLTAYALTVAIVAIPVALVHRRLHPLPLVATGLGLFSLASLAAGAAPNLTFLLVARCAQGVGATLLLGGSLPILAEVGGSAARARVWWAGAAAVGAAVGPALGGVLTQLADWRAIFFTQAPIAAAALLVCFDPAARAAHTRAAPAHRVRHRGVIVANIGFALVFAALVGALFLGVLLAIEVWRYSPVEGALLVTALPVGMLVARWLRNLPPWLAAVGGPVLLALGLAGLAYLPGAEPAMAAVALALCGAGFDIVGEVFAPVAVPEGAPPVQAATASIGARHAGLVLGLLLIAPVLSKSIDDGIDRATLGATRSMLEVNLPLSDKLPVTWALRTAIEEAPHGQVPDLPKVFEEKGASKNEKLAAARDGLMETVTDAITRSFRPAFGVAAILAALAAIPALVVVRPRRGTTVAATRSGSRLAPSLAIGGLLVIGGGLLVVEHSAGAADVGEFVAVDPCTAPPDTYEGKGLDAVVQRIALSALNGAACDLGTTRERLVLSLDENSGYEDVTWDKPTAEEALRKGAKRAIDDADDRGSIPGWVAAALKFTVDHAPIGWLVDRLPIPGT